MKKMRFSFQLNIALFLLPLFVIGTLNFFVPNRPTISELENRVLKTRPVFAWEKLFRGELTREYEEYFADNFIFREKFVQLSGKFKELWALPGSDKVALVINKGANVAQTQNNQPTNPQNQNSGNQNNQNANEQASPKATVNTTNNVLVINDKAMEIHTFNAEASQNYAAFLNEFQERLASQGNGGNSHNNVTVYSLLAPTQIEFISQKEYQSLSSPQKKTINYINGLLNEQVIPVDAYTALQQHTGEYLYFRSDHHWTALGAYYAYTAFMRTQGIEPVPLEQYTVEEIKPFLGSLYSTTLSAEIRDNPDTLYLYKPFTGHQYAVYYQKEPVETPLLDLRHAENKNKYGIFLSGDVPWGVITTEVKNGRKLAVIKDSYANAFIPFLLPHYEEIYVIDPRQFQQEIFQFIQDKGIQQVLFLNYILVTNDHGFTDLLRQMSFPDQ